MKLHLVSQILSLLHHKVKLTGSLQAAHVQGITLLREQYRCPHFRILVIGRANAGKTTILEKVCGVAKGTQPIIIHDKIGKLDERQMYVLSHIMSLPGNKLEPSETHLIPSIEVSQCFTMDMLSDCISPEGHT